MLAAGVCLLGLNIILVISLVESRASTIAADG
jgi:hypothetical protein